MALFSLRTARFLESTRNFNPPILRFLIVSRSSAVKGPCRCSCCCSSFWALSLLSLSLPHPCRSARMRLARCRTCESVSPRERTVVPVGQFQMTSSPPRSCVAGGSAPAGTVSVHSCEHRGQSKSEAIRDPGIAQSTSKNSREHLLGSNAGSASTGGSHLRSPASSWIYKKRKHTEIRMHIIS